MNPVEMRPPTEEAMRPTVVDTEREKEKQSLLILLRNPFVCDVGGNEPGGHETSYRRSNETSCRRSNETPCSGHKNAHYNRYTTFSNDYKERMEDMFSIILLILL